MSIITHNSAAAVFHLDEIQDSIQVFTFPLTSSVLVTGKNSHMVKAKKRIGPHRSFPSQTPACPIILVSMLSFLSVCQLYCSKMRSASPPDARRHRSMKLTSNSTCCRDGLYKGSVTSCWTAFALHRTLTDTEIDSNRTLGKCASVPLGWTL